MQGIENKEYILASIENSILRRKFTKAVEKCNKGIKRFPESEIFLRLKGEALLNIEDRREEGREIFQGLIFNGSRSAENYCGLAIADYLSGKFEDAIKGFKKAIKTEKTKVSAARFMAYSLCELDRVDEALKLLDDHIKKLKKSCASCASQLMATKVCIQRQTGRDEGLRDYAIEAVKLCTENEDALYELRKLNPPTNFKKTKNYFISIEGKTNVFNFFSKKPCLFMGSYEVMANSKEEALDYIKEIQVYGDPDTLKIMTCKKQKLNRKEKNLGVLVIYPSTSCEEIESDIPEDVIKSMGVLQ